MSLKTNETTETTHLSLGGNHAAKGTTNTTPVNTTNTNTNTNNITTTTTTKIKLNDDA